MIEAEAVDDHTLFFAARRSKPLLFTVLHGLEFTWLPVSGIKTKWPSLTPPQGRTDRREGRHRDRACYGIVQQGNKLGVRASGQKPFTYQAGVGGVIKGWDRGLLGAAVGESRKLDIPAEEGYGARGFPAWGIPPTEPLFRDHVIEIKGARRVLKRRPSHSTSCPSLRSLCAPLLLGCCVGVVCLLPVVVAC